MKHADFEIWKKISLCFVINKIHPEFLKAVDQNAGWLLCKLSAEYVVGLIATAKVDVTEAKGEVHKLKESAFDAELSQSFADCLPKSKEKHTKPKGCY
jgi:hypothetical protein